MSNAFHFSSLHNSPHWKGGILLLYDIMCPFVQIFAQVDKNCSVCHVLGILEPAVLIATLNGKELTTLQNFSQYTAVADIKESLGSFLCF